MMAASHGSFQSSFPGVPILSDLMPTEIESNPEYASDIQRSRACATVMWLDCTQASMNHHDPLFLSKRVLCRALTASHDGTVVL